MLHAQHRDNILAKLIKSGVKMIKVVVDAFGGDNAQVEVIKGVAMALSEDAELA